MNNLPVYDFDSNPRKQNSSPFSPPWLQASWRQSERLIVGCRVERRGAHHDFSEVASSW